jgi:hypothetical protein
VKKTIHYNNYPVNPVYPVRRIKKRNEPKVGEASVLHIIEKTKQTQIPILGFLGSLSLVFLGSVHFVQTNPILKNEKQPYMLITKGHIKHEIVLQTAKK